MLDSAATSLHRYCKNCAGDSLCEIRTYEQGGLDYQYLRNDLESLFESPRKRQRIGELAWENHVRRRELFDELDETGDIEAVVFSLEHAFIIQFPEADEGGLLASFDADAGRFLGDFIEDCRARIRPALEKD